MTVMKLSTRDQTVHCASTTLQTAEENLKKERMDATEALVEQAAKASEAVAARREVDTGLRNVTSVGSPATTQTNALMPQIFKRF